MVGKTNPEVKPGQRWVRTYTHSRESKGSTVEEISANQKNTALNEIKTITLQIIAPLPFDEVGKIWFIFQKNFTNCNPYDQFEYLQGQDKPQEI